MEFSLTVSTTVVAIFILVVYLLQILITKTERNGGKNKKPPQAKGAWPIIGHLHLLAGSQLPHVVLGDMADKYGSIFSIKLGVHEALVVSDGEMAKECFTTNDKAFASRPKSVAVEVMGYNYALLGFTPYGDYWRQMRKIYTVEVLSQRRVEMVEHVRVSEVRSSVKEMYDAWVKNKESGGSDMMKVEMKQWFGSMVLNIILRIAAGKRFESNDEEGVRFQEVTRKFFELMGAFVVSDFIPCLKRLDLGGYERAMKSTAKEMDDIVEGLLEERKRGKELGQESESNQVFVDALSSILQASSKDDFPGFDHHTIIKAACLQILVAAMDTSSATLSWALSLLLNNPEALKVAQDEIDEHVGRERPVEESDLKNLVYLDAIIKETLRLYPVAPLSVVHESMEDCIVSGYHVPKGTQLIANLWKLQRDPNVWSDPNEFQPERFLSCHKDIDVRGKHFELLPFGSGRRLCPGISFSLQALRYILASLIQHFTLKKPSDELVDLSESGGLTNCKATPLDVLLAPRLPIHVYMHNYYMQHA